jgi:N-acetylornithine carbamoyltransferase
VRVAHPPGFALHPQVLEEAQRYAADSGGSIFFTHEQAEAISGARVVYAKAWGPATKANLPPQSVRDHRSWMITPEHMESAARDAMFLHCLPVRRNVEIADAVLDGRWSRVIDEAENRFHVQRALLEWLLN